MPAETAPGEISGSCPKSMRPTSTATTAADRARAVRPARARSAPAPRVRSVPPASASAAARNATATAAPRSSRTGLQPGRAQYALRARRPGIGPAPSQTAMRKRPPRGPHTRPQPMLSSLISLAHSHAAGISSTPANPAQARGESQNKAARNKSQQYQRRNHPRSEHRSMLLAGSHSQASSVFGGGAASADLSCSLVRPKRRSRR